MFCENEKIVLIYKLGEMKHFTINNVYTVENRGIFDYDRFVVRDDKNELTGISWNWVLNNKIFIRLKDIRIQKLKTLNSVNS